MPELPEVESLRRILVRTAVGRTIVSVRIGEKPLRRRATADFSGAIIGRRIVKLSRRAKYLIIEFDGEHVILVHLGMSGSLTHRHEGFDADDFDPRHDHLEFALDDASRLVYNDPRRFGMVRLVERAALASTARAEGLGPEPLSREFQCGLSCSEGPRPDRGDQEPDYGSTNRRGYRQYLRVRDFISGGRASDAACGPRDAKRDRKNRGGHADHPARRDRQQRHHFSQLPRFARTARAIRRAPSRIRPRGKTVLHMLDANQKCGGGTTCEFLLSEMSALRCKSIAMGWH